MYTKLVSDATAQHKPKTIPNFEANPNHDSDPYSNPYSNTYPNHDFDPTRLTPTFASDPTRLTLRPDTFRIG